MSVVTVAWIAFAVALAAGLLFTPAARGLAHKVGLVYRPTEDRWSRKPTAMLGGVAIALASAVGVIVGLLVPSAAVTEPTILPTVGVFTAALVMFAVGLVDDVVHMRPQLKFVLQVLAGVVLISLGAVATLTPWYWVNALLTLLWFVAVTNAFNLLDNMDGVAGGVAAIAAFFLGIAFLSANAAGAAMAAWALSGAAFAFLVFNFHPASIFMGDAGSLFIGALLAGLVVASPSATSGSLVSVLFVPLAIVGVPVLDTALVTVTRSLTGRGISQGGRDHSTHRLVALGLSEKQVALLLYAFSIGGGLVALALTGLARDAALIVGTVFLVGMALLAAYLGRLHVEHPNESRGSRQVTVLLTRLLFKRRLAEILLDVVLVSVAWYSAFALRFDGHIDPSYRPAFEGALAPLVAGKILLFAMFGVYRGTWQYASLTDFFRIIGALIVAAVGLYAAAELWLPPLALSHSVIYIDALCAAALVLASRTSFRGLELLRRSMLTSGEPVIIYGAGDAGELAYRELRNNRGLKLTPVCFLDDDPRKHGRHIHGVPIAGGIESLALAAEQHRATVVVIGTGKLRPHVMEALQAYALRSGARLVELDLRFKPVAGEPAIRPQHAKPLVRPARSARSTPSGVPVAD